MLPLAGISRHSLTTAAVLAIAAVASAQVGTTYAFTQSVGTYTPIVGTLIAAATTANTMDDNSYTLTLPFAFPFDGSTYTTITAQTNGFVSIGTTAPGTTYAPLSSTVAVNGMVSAFGRDLQGGFVFSCDKTATSNVLTNVSSTGPLQVGDVLTGTGITTGTTITAIAGNTITMSAGATATSVATYDTAYGPWSNMSYETQGVSPNQVFVVQWSGFKRYGTTLTTVQDMTLNFQIRLSEGGAIDIVYGNCTPGATTYTTTSQVGLRGPNSTFPTSINNRMNTKGVNDDWSQSVVGTSNTAGMLFNNVAPANVIASGLTYHWQTNPGVPATNTSYGAGCYNRSATWYEQFGTFDLSGAALQLIPNGQGGYTMLPAAPTAFVHTVAGLALTDDSVGTLALPTAFNYPGGSTSSLSICSNGYIWAQSNTLADFSPSAAELFSNPARYSPIWADLLPDGTTNVANVFAEVDGVNNKAYVTWANVPTFTAGGTVNVQVEFDLSSGIVTYSYGACTVPSGVTLIAGWTPGTGASAVDSGSLDITAALPATFSTISPEIRALALTASATAVLGTTVVYTTSNIPAATPFAVQLISLGQINPGIDLGAIGAPGCVQLVDLSLATTSLVFGAPTAAFSCAIPNIPTLVSLPLNLQSAAFDASANVLGVVTSNGIRSIVGNF